MYFRVASSLSCIFVYYILIYRMYFRVSKYTIHDTRYTIHDTCRVLKVKLWYEVYSIIALWILCDCAHFRGLTSQRAAQCNGILMSLLVFQIKPHYMKLLLHALTQIQLLYLRICIFHFSFILIDLPTVSVCTVFSTYSTCIGICTYTYGYGVRVPYIL